MERWHTFADDLVDDATAMFAVAVPGIPAVPAEPPTVEEIIARLQLPRAVAVRRKGAEFREVLAAVIRAFPDNLTGLDQALAMTEQLLLHAGFAVLPHRDATAFRNTARYRVLAACAAFPFPDGPGRCWSPTSPAARMHEGGDVQCRHHRPGHGQVPECAELMSWLSGNVREGAT